jgi:hypothetical protein
MGSFASKSQKMWNETWSNKNRNPHCGSRRRVAAGLDPVSYSILFDDGYDTDDEEEA